MPLPSNQPKLNFVGKHPGSTIGLAIAATIAVTIPLTQRWEGYVGKTYLDPANIPTQCYGETKDIDPSVIYSKDQCATKLRKRLAADYAPVLAKCMPVMVGPDWEKYTQVYAALLDASYNAGPERVCVRFAPVVNVGEIKAVCDALPGWFITARDRKTGVRKVYKGLINRRNHERQVCLKGL